MCRVFVERDMTMDWVESVEVFGEWAAQAMEQAQADREWRAYVEGLA